MSLPTPTSYSHHARQRMAERGYTRQDVEFVVRNPEGTYTDRNGNLSVVGTTANGKRMRVVLAVQDKARVVTVAPRD